MAIIGVLSGQLGSSRQLVGTLGTFDLDYTTGLPSGVDRVIRTNPTTTAHGRVIFGAPSANGAIAAGGWGATGEVWVQGYVRFATLPASNDEEFFSAFRVGGSTFQFTLRITSDRKVRIYSLDGANSATVLSETAASALPSGDLLLGVHFVPNSTTGSVEVFYWDDGTEDWISTVSKSSIKTEAGSTGNGAIGLGKFNRNGNSVDFLYWNWIASNSGFIGPVQSKVLVPNGTGGITFAGTGTGANDYTEIDSVPPTEANYLVASAGAQNCLPAFGDFSESYDEILAVQLLTLVASASSTTASRIIRLRTASDSDSTAANLTSTTPAGALRLALLDPHDSAAWTDTKVNSVTAGVRDNSGSERVRCHGALLEVFYTETSGASAALSGTLATGADEADVRAGGTLIIDVTGTTLVDPFDDTLRQAVVDGIVPNDLNVTFGWWNIVRTALIAGFPSSVVRTSATKITVTVPADSDYWIGATQNFTVALHSSLTELGDTISVGSFSVADVAGTATLGGNVTAGVTEADIVAGTKELTITLVGNEWRDTLTDPMKQAIIDGFTGSYLSGTGWNDEVTPTLAVGDVARSSDTLVTINLPACASYSLTGGDDEISFNLPSTAVKDVTSVDGENTFTISAITTAVISGSAFESQIVNGGRTIAIELFDDTWVSGGSFNDTVKQAIIDGLDGSVAGGNGFDVEVEPTLAPADVSRQSDTVVWITLPAVAGYSVGTNETVSAVVPASAVAGGAPITATGTFNITDGEPEGAAIPPFSGLIVGSAEMQYAALGDTVYFWFGLNNTDGSGDDGSSLAFAVRKAGAAAGAAPTLTGSATILSHASYNNGCAEVAIVASSGNGFEANATYGVFATGAVSGENPTGFLGTLKLDRLHVDAREINGSDEAAAALSARGKGAGYGTVVGTPEEFLDTDNLTKLRFSVAFTGTIPASLANGHFNDQRFTVASGDARFLTSEVDDFDPTSGDPGSDGLLTIYPSFSPQPEDGDEFSLSG